MKKWFFFIALLTAKIAYALPVGNIAEPALFTNGLIFRPGSFFNACHPCYLWIDDWSFRIGFYGDYVFDRDLEVTRGNLKNDKLDRTEIFTNGAYLALNFSDFASLYGMFGVTHFKFIYNQDFLILTVPLEITTKTEFSWSVGAHAILLNWRCFSLGIQGAYFATRPKLKFLVSAVGGGIEHFDGDSRSAIYQEWQIAWGISYRIFTWRPRVALVPYVAGTFSRAKLNMRHNLIPLTPLPLPNFVFKRNWGVAIGSSLTFCDAIGVTVEGRLGPEKAVYVNGQFRF